jgi:hypothetical protein
MGYDYRRYNSKEIDRDMPRESGKDTDLELVV